jgi:transposase InsO family protein
MDPERVCAWHLLALVRASRDVGSTLTSATHCSNRRRPRTRACVSANALAESFVDTIKTELVRDRVWRSQSQLELAIVAYIGWYNHDRLHEALGDLPPVEYETLALAKTVRS